jgi:hypothetical protein
MRGLGDLKAPDSDPSTGGHALDAFALLRQEARQ